MRGLVLTTLTSLLCLPGPLGGQTTQAGTLTIDVPTLLELDFSGTLPGLEPDFTVSALDLQTGEVFGDRTTSFFRRHNVTVDVLLTAADPFMTPKKGGRDDKPVSDLHFDPNGRGMRPISGQTAIVSNAPPGVGSYTVSWKMLVSADDSPGEYTAFWVVTIIAN